MNTSAMHEPTSFDVAISLQPVSQGHYRASIPGSWTASGRAAGGLVEAQMLAALDARMGDSDKQPLSFTAHLLRAPEAGDVELHTDVLREGRSISNLAVRMMQHDKLIATALSSFAIGRPSPELDELPMPEVEPPTADRAPDSYVPDFAMPYGANIVIQDRLGPKPLAAPDGPMERVGWVGFAQPCEITAPALVMVGDIGMMGWWVRLDRMHATATLDHTTHFRADLRTPPADDMVLMWNRTSLVRNGYLDWDAAVWSSDGTLLCHSRQLLAVLGPAPT